MDSPLHEIIKRKGVYEVTLKDAFAFSYAKLYINKKLLSTLFF